MKSPLLIIATLCVLTASLTAQSARDDRRTISVTGEAFAYFEPDRAAVTIGVVTDGKTVAEAKKENDERSAVLIKAIRKLGFEDKDIRTSGLSIQPVYDYKSDDRRLIKYTMSNSVTVTIKDLTKVDDLLNRGLDGAGNVLNGVRFYIEDPESVRDSLQVEATLNAKAKAQRVASALGVAVGKPVTILVDAQSGSSPSFVVRGSRTTESAMLVDSSPETGVSAGSTRVEATVHVTFEIE